jgi:hypothetical protein
MSASTEFRVGRVSRADRLYALPFAIEHTRLGGGHYFTITVFAWTFYLAWWSGAQTHATGR